jgi:hypothetical protein
MNFSDYKPEELIGKKVILECFGKFLETIERVTKTQIILKDSAKKYKISNGHEITSEQWFKGTIHLATPKQEQEIINTRDFKHLRNNLINILPNLSYKKHKHLLNDIKELTEKIKKELL